MNIIKYRNWFFALSLAIILPGIFAIFFWGLKLGVDFSGGTIWEINFPQNYPSRESLQEVFAKESAHISSLASTSQTSYLLKMETTEESKINKIKENLNQNFGKTKDVRLETVGPVISKELTEKAIKATAISIFAIVIYVTWAFRKIPKPTSSIAFGVTTIIALIHDVIIVVGAFAILGRFFGIEVDSLFITALLTVLGFSVHDTIVVFDRIRENLRKYQETSFEEIVNHSLTQTLARSLNTSLTVVFVLLALLLFGGSTIRPFVLALLIGVVSGTYSSIFNAAPLLVVWNNLKNKKG